MSRTPPRVPTLGTCTLRAQAGHPGYAQGRYWFGLYLMSQGRFEEAFAQIRRAEELDPLAPIIHTAAAFARMIAGDHDGVLDQARKALDLVPDFWQANAMSSLGFLRKGKWDEAIAEGEQAVRLSGGAPWALMTLGIVHAESGRRREAQEVLERMEQRRSEGYFPPTYIAFVYAALGEVDLAFEWLDRAYEERDIFITDLKVRPVLEGLRSDPRFTQLLRRVGFE